jgi:hypothetical protein
VDIFLLLKITQKQAFRTFPNFYEIKEDSKNFGFYNKGGVM